MVASRSRVTSWYVIFAVVLIGTMYHTNTSSFVVLINSIASDMLVFNGGDMQPDQIGWLISIPSLFMIPGVLLSPLILQKIKMRTFMIVSWALFGLSGLAIFFCETTLTVLACRAVMGFAIGLCQPSSRALPSRVYDDTWRGRVLGWVDFIGGAMSMLCSLVFGQIAMIDWRLSMFCYPVIALIVIALAVLFVPNLPVEKDQRQAQLRQGPKRALGLTVWVLVIAAFVCFVIGAVIQIKTSIIVDELGLGGPDVAALVSMANTFGIVVFGFLFGWLYKWLGRWLYPIGLLITTAGYFWFANSHDTLSLCVSGAVASGVAIGILMVYNIARVTYTAPVERITTAITLITLASYVGQVFTTPFINLVEGIWGGSATVSLTAVGVVFGAMFIIALSYVFATRKMDFSAPQAESGEEADVARG